jgi:hypothetical protein
MRCQNCCRRLTTDEPVYRVATGYHSKHWDGGTVGSLCTYCATQSPGARFFPDQRWRPPEPCCHCGRPVILNGRRRAPHSVTCGNRCQQAIRNAAQWEIVPSERACPICGVTFAPKRIDATYCSHVCRQTAYRNRRGRAPSERACPICGVTFAPKRIDSTYCSRACTLRAYRNRRGRAPSKRACPICGVTFAPKRIASTYCSHACRLRAYRNRQEAGRPSSGAPSRSPAVV